VADRLREYENKRDFERTPEPAAKRPTPRKDAAPRFVVHEHHARRLHWDLRLEREGVLASWAIPNGIPEDPAENRKAIHTEDHPLSYLDFEGTIPAGEYGAGEIHVWDTGTYEAEKFREDEVIVVFRGERLTGRYALFRTGGRDWMIHRMDPPADPGREPMPERLVPMLARPGEVPADEEAWAFEVKWDGVRALVYSEPGRIRLASRNLRDITAHYPELRGLNRALGSRRAVLDGEIVAFDGQGRPSFERLQQRMHLASESVIQRRMRDIPVTLVLFDVLHLDGHTTCALPYTQRRERLEALDLEGPAWRTPAYRAGDGAALLEASRQQDLEGIVAKRLDSRYEPGRRSGGWVKIKNTHRQELVIGGWLPGEGRRRERIGALLVGHYDAAPAEARRRGERPRLVFAGRVGTGFTERELERLAARLGPLRRERSPFAARRAKRSGGGLPHNAVWVKPELVAEVEYREWTAEGMLRAPSYKGLRDDADAREVVLERAPTAEQDHPPEGGVLGPARPLRGGGAEVEVEGRRLKLSNLGKVLYPAAGFTKADVVDYYARIAPAVLPHLHGRPLTLKRYPDGVEGPHFYEKQYPSHRPDWVRTVGVSAGSKRIDFCLAEDVPTLVWLANLADLELHTSLALGQDVSSPTMMVFDLDPGPGAGVLECCRVGLWLRGLFEELGLEILIKTSGSKGLQAYVPLNTPVSYEETKTFARAVAEALERREPGQVVSRMAKELRPGKVLVDWSQNDEHKTTVCVYSLRARERPTVSTPLQWDEVEGALAAEDPGRLVFDAAAVLERVESHGDLFAPVLTTRQALPSL